MGESTKLSVEQRKAIFLSLTEAQDAGQSVEGSRKAVAKQYEVSEDVVKKIEAEGSEKDWPPL